MQAGDRMFKTRGTRDRCPASTLTVDASASLPAAPRRLPGLRNVRPGARRTHKSPQCAKKGKPCGKGAGGSDNINRCGFSEGGRWGLLRLWTSPLLLIRATVSRACTSRFLIVKWSFPQVTIPAGAPPLLFPAPPPNLGWGRGNPSPRPGRVPALLGLAAPLLWSMCGPLAPGQGMGRLARPKLPGRAPHMSSASASCTPAAAHTTPAARSPSRSHEIHVC